jgi:hypothetical protein
MLTSDPFQSQKKRTLLIVGVMVFLALIIVFFSQRPTTQNAFSESTALGQRVYAPDSSFLDEEDVGYDADFSGELTESAMQDDSAPPPPLRQPVDFSAGGAPVENVTTRRIQNGFIDIRVENIEKTMVEVSRIAQSGEGNISNSSISYDSNERYATAILRIPSEKFDRILAQIRGVAIEIKSEETSTRDVTREFVDLEAQLKNKKAQEEQIRTFFEKAEKVEDLITVENALSRVRNEVERLQGQMNYLESQTSFSTISITMRESVRSINQSAWNPGIVAKDAFAQLVERFQRLFTDVIRITISSLPLFLFSMLFLLASYRVGRKVIRVILAERSRSDQ